MPPTHFDIEPGDETYERLYTSGYDAAKEFFSSRINLDMLIHKVQARFGWKGTEY